MQNAASKKVGLIVLVRLDTAGMENHAKILTNVKKERILAAQMLLVRTPEEASSARALKGSSETVKCAPKCAPKKPYQRI